MLKRNAYDKKTRNRTGEPLPPGKTEETKGGHKGPSGTTTTGRVHNVPVDMSNWRRKVKVSRLKFDDVQKDIYLESIQEDGLKTKAAKVAGVSLNTVARHREDDPDFCDAESEAVAVYASKVIDHHQKLIFEGEIHKSYDKDGNLLSEKHTYPIQLIAMELKRVDHSYRENIKLDVDANSSKGGVLVAPADMTVPEWLAMCKEENERQEREALEANGDDAIDITPEPQPEIIEVEPNK